jgi:hypothetical protein
MENRNYQRYTDEQRVFTVNTFYKTESNSETCCIFHEHLYRSIKSDTVANLIKHCEATGSVEDLARPGRQRSTCTHGFTGNALPMHHTILGFTTSTSL